MAEIPAEIRAAFLEGVWPSPIEIVVPVTTPEGRKGHVRLRLRVVRSGLQVLIRAEHLRRVGVSSVVEIPHSFIFYKVVPDGLSPRQIFVWRAVRSHFMESVLHYELAQSRRSLR